MTLEDDVAYYRDQADRVSRELKHLAEDRAAALATHGEAYIEKRRRDLALWRQLAGQSSCLLGPAPDEQPGSDPGAAPLF